MIASRYRTTWIAAILLCLFAFPVLAQFGDSPFSSAAELVHVEGDSVVNISFTIPKDHYLYADQISVQAQEGVVLEPREIPPSKQKKDAFSAELIEVYDHSTRFTYTVTGHAGPKLAIEVSYQGCSATVCFMPQTDSFDLSGTAAVPPDITQVSPAPPVDQSFSWRDSLATDFTVTGRTTGYLNPADFLEFLDNSVTGKGMKQDRLAAAFNRSIWLTVLLILVGGLALNLTPCVLPMIPINIAIIGAGAQAGSRARGFALGAVYGLGIALVYGVLGVLAVVTGARFGSLNSLPLFNITIALVFVVMGLAMFDVLQIDFSRFQKNSAPAEGKRGSFLTALVLGSVAALLAGACVAPVLISVLLLSANLYSNGNHAGLVLPFLLGVGMALPWPFAGAGLSFLPKPGKWMERVKFVFGILIFAMAIYYAHTAYTQFRTRMATGTPGASAAHAAEDDAWIISLDEALAAARSSGKPLFIDFWATWCKNCVTMDKTTFKNEEVKSALSAFVKAKIQAEDLRNPQTRAMLDPFDVKGLPTYIVLKPRANNET